MTSLLCKLHFHKDVLIDTECIDAGDNDPCSPWYEGTFICLRCFRQQRKIIDETIYFAYKKP